MKKFILPAFLFSLFVLFLLSPKVDAQTDNEPKEVTSCKELKELYSGKKCGKYTMVSAWPSGSARPDPMEFWCFVEEPTYDPVEGDSHLATVIKRKRPPDYFMKLSEYDRCSEGTESPADNGKDKEPSGWELPGKAFWEFIRKVQDLRLGKQQEENKDVGSDKEELPSETKANAVNEW